MLTAEEQRRLEKAKAEPAKDEPKMWWAYCNEHNTEYLYQSGKMGCPHCEATQPAPAVPKDEYGRLKAQKDAILAKEQAEMQAVISRQYNEIATLRQQLAEAERNHLQTVDERDEAEDALGDAYVFVTGHAAEWSNLFGYDEATNEIAEKVKELQEQASVSTIRSQARPSSYNELNVARESSNGNA